MRQLALILALCVVCGSCRKSVERKPTFPVTGAVTVDGKAVEQIAVRCICETGLDEKDPTESFSFTDKEGKFKISTYQSGDGVPVGRYMLTFQMGKRNLFSGNYEGDGLNGKYIDPKTSTIKFEVQEGQPTELGMIPLTTQ